MSLERKNHGFYFASSRVNKYKCFNGSNVLPEAKGLVVRKSLFPSLGWHLRQLTYSPFIPGLCFLYTMSTPASFRVRAVPNKE